MNHGPQKGSVGDPPTLILRGCKGGRVALPPFTLIDESLLRGLHAPSRMQGSLPSPELELARKKQLSATPFSCSRGVPPDAPLGY